MNRPAALLLCMVLSGLIAWAASRTPAPAPADAPASAFSADRAWPILEAIGSRAHPIGSAQDAAVRADLAARFAALGLSTQVWAGRAFEAQAASGEEWIEGGLAQDVVAVLPGRSRTAPALLVMAHYDSVPSSPGAADDSTGVAAALEVARALRASRTPARDVIFLLTDGEEAGLLGARAFFADNPLARRVGAVLNLESRGGGGRVYMFETGQRSGGMIGLFGRTAVNPTASSLSSYVYAHMSNDTDFTVAKRLGIAGLNYAFIGRPFDYHAASSTPARTDRGSLQHMGEQILAASRALADAPVIPAGAPDVVYDDLLGGPVIAYPAWAGWLILLAAGGLAAAAFAGAGRDERLVWRDAARGAGLLVLAAAGTGVLLWSARRLTGVPFGFVEEKALMARWPVYEAMLGAGCLAGALLASALAGVRARSAWSAWAGALALGFVLAAALQAAAPLVAFMLAWPLLVSALIAATLRLRWSGQTGGPSALVFTALAAVPALGQLLYVAHAVTLGVGSELPEVLAAFVLLAALIVFPLLWSGGRARWRAATGAVSLLVCVGLALVLRVTAPWDQRHPRPTDIVYAADLDQARFWRLSPLPHPDAWTRAALQADGGAIRQLTLLPVAPQALAAPARPIAAARPDVSITRTAEGEAVVRLIPRGQVRQLRLALRVRAPPGGVTIDGLAAPASPGAGRWTHIAWDGDPAGLTVVLKTPPGPIDAHWAEVIDGWPPDARRLPPRPADVMPWMNSDTTMLAGAVRLSGGQDPPEK